MADATLPESPAERNDDYTGAVCLLHLLTRKYPVYEEVLVDAEDYPFLSQFEWRIAEVRKDRAKRVVRRSDFAYLHRIIMTPPDGYPVDHRFHRPLDNRRSMLRVGTYGDNNLNARKQKNATSRFKGVHRCSKTGRWRVQFGRRSNRIFLGMFDDEVEAARAYNEYAKREFGEFACLNPV
jgi:hypothetical protein